MSPTDTIDLLSLLSFLPAAVAHWVPYVIVACAVLAAVIPAPAPTSPWAGAYRLVNAIGLNFWHARNLVTPEVVAAAQTPLAEIAKSV